MAMSTGPVHGEKVDTEMQNRYVFEATVLTTELASLVLQLLTALARLTPCSQATRSLIDRLASSYRPF